MLSAFKPLALLSTYLHRMSHTRPAHVKMALRCLARMGQEQCWSDKALRRQDQEKPSEDKYLPVILRISRESGMLNSITESSFSFLFSMRSSSCKRVVYGPSKLPELDQSCFPQRNYEIKGQEFVFMHCDTNARHLPFLPVSRSEGSHLEESHFCIEGSPNSSQ